MSFKNDLIFNSNGKIEAFENEFKEFYTMKNLIGGINRMSRERQFVKNNSLSFDDFKIPLRGKERKEYFQNLWDCICDLIIMHDKEVDKTKMEVPCLVVKPLDKQDEVRLKIASWYINVGVIIDNDLECVPQGDIPPVNETPSNFFEPTEDELQAYLEFTQAIEEEIYGSVPQDP